MKVTPGSIEGTHVVLTGPITGTVELEDGTVVDVSAPFIEVSDEQAAEIAHRIGERYAAEGHPDDVDAETGERVPFEYQAPAEFAGHSGSDSKSKKKG